MNFQSDATLEIEKMEENHKHWDDNLSPQEAGENTPDAAVSINID